MSEPTRTYEHNGLKVEWRSELCTHCKACWLGLPEVFNPDMRPWVNMEGATADQITEQVNECPSGALQVAE